MATLTLYSQNAAAPYMPTTVRGGWDSTTYSTSTRALGVTKSGVISYQQVTENSAVANFDRLIYRASYILTSGMIFSGAVTGCLGCRESNALVNAYLHWHLFLTEGQSNTVRSTLLADQIDTEEWSTTTTTSGESFAGNIATPITGYSGDVLVLEVGSRSSSTGTTYTNRIYYGGTSAVDLSDGGNSTLYPGWLSLTYTIPATAAPVFMHHYQSRRM